MQVARQACDSLSPEALAGGGEYAVTRGWRWAGHDEAQGATESRRGLELGATDHTSRPLLCPSNSLLTSCLVTWVGDDAPSMG